MSEDFKRAFELIDRIEVQCKSTGHVIGGLTELKSLIMSLNIKARKFDQLVEVRRKTTSGKWVFGDDDVIVSEGIADICFMTRPLNSANVDFITLAATLTQE